MYEKILILDFGSQYTQLIARKVRELGVYSEIVPYNISRESIEEKTPKGIIHSGGPQSVFLKNALLPFSEIFKQKVPILGVCYGLQLIAHILGGRVVPSSEREYGKAVMEVVETKTLFRSFKKGEETVVWMSHGDRVEALPEGFRAIARTGSSPFAVISDESEAIFGVQFHPEVVLEEFFLGPTLEEQTQGLIAVTSGATGFSSLVVGDGVAHVYLEGVCNSGGATYTIAQPLAVNLKQFDAIETVKIYDENGGTEVPDGPSDSIPFCLEP